MFDRVVKTVSKSPVSAAVVAILISFLLAHAAFAKLAANTIDPVAVLADDGRHLIVTGPVTCTEGERSLLRVTVTQRSTGALAEGTAFLTCAGGSQHWEVQVSTEGDPIFQEGAATVVALARTTSHGETTDAHQWLVNITLVRQ